MPRKLLLIEDDEAFSRRLQANLRSAGFGAEIAATGAEAMRLLHSEYFDLVVTDIRLPDLDGLAILRRIKEGAENLDPDLPVVVLTSVRDIETAVGAMRDGAADYITKESEKSEIVVRLEHVLEQSALLNENRYLRGQLERQDEFRDLVGESAAIREIKREISRLAGQDVPVLVTGETGVGKELVARALHRTGSHPGGPFVDVNCGALPDENLLLSDLFGHERGAFTGAVSLKRGKFEMAKGGTLFLDEIGEMPPGPQAKILKAIETLKINRLGGTQTIDVGCRLVFATHRTLEEEVRAGRFREDLYYRINLLPIHVPPLRERRDDVAVLARFFLGQFSAKYRNAPRGFDEESLVVLRAYNWPGNVRELRNVVERLAIRSSSETIRREDLERCGVSLEGRAPSPIALPEEGISLEEVERRLVVEALERSEWSQKRAAQILGISVDRMNARVRKYGLTHPSWRVHR
ncbi:sigma-54-dependent Fis family transcriptional regulator [Candidatus Sumerlaeota bacterium]|nr:sigma-54-dependent Fis family transcriptional regulator [Candidatus Sumerlaeota bacterium]